MTRDDRLRIAVFIDFDNIEIGVKNTLGASFDAGLVLEALRERGDVVSKTAYSDWQRAGSYSRMLTQHAIKMVQRNLTPGGDKNGADINLALDALEMAFTHPHINAFVIVGGDSDFISLVEKLKQYDKKVFVVGGRQFTSQIMQRNCHEFIAYENLASAAPVPAAGGRRPAGRGVRVERSPIEQVIPLVNRALQVLSDREVSPQMGLLKTTLLQLDSTFSERNYGAGSFRDFVQKLEKAGVVKVHHGKGGLLVAPAETPSSVAETSAAEEIEVPGTQEPPAPPASSPRVSSDARSAGASTDGNGQGPAVIGTMTEGLGAFQQIVASGQVRRWPMYLRNVKQLIRQVQPGFDERAYGFANLVDLLRAATKEGIVRVDRDRQGVIRVFQPTPAGAPVQTHGTKVFEDAEEVAEEYSAASGDVDAPVGDGEFGSEAAGATVIEFPAVEPPLLSEEVETAAAVDPAGTSEPDAAEEPAVQSKRPRRRSSGGARKSAARSQPREASTDASTRPRSSRTRRPRKS